MDLAFYGANHLPQTLQPSIILPKNHEKNRKMGQLSHLQSQVSNNPSAFHQMMESSMYLQTSKAFLEGQLNLVLDMLKLTNKKFEETHTENQNLKRKLKDYEENLYKSQSNNLGQPQKGQTVYKPALIEKRNQEDQVKTMKRTMENKEQRIDKKLFLQRISQFQLENLKLPKKEQDLNQSEPQNNSLRQPKYGDQTENQNIKKQIRSYQELINKFTSQCQKATLEKNLLNTRFEALEKRYNQLEDLHGKKVTQYEITIENLRQVLRGLNEKKSPKKTNKKLEEGYYSINRPLDRNQSHSSISSSGSKFQQNSLGHYQANLQEQNEYLRTQLIKALDEKGQIKSELNKYKKAMTKEFSKQKTNDENNQNQMNSQEGTKNEHRFKKNKTSSILLVQNTQKKQKEILEQLRERRFRNEFGQIISEVPGEIRQKFDGPYCPKNDNFGTLFGKTQQIHLKHDKLIEQLQRENTKLKREKDENEQKSKNYINQLHVLLKDLLQNPSGNKSFDSTDQAFKNIQLSYHQQKQNKSSQKLKECLQKISQQQKEIAMLRNKIASYEEISESFYRLTSQSPSQSHPNFSLIKRNEIAPISSVKSQTPQVLNEGHIIELSSFELFKQKLTEFYEHTIKQLNQWQNSAIKNGHSPMKKTPMLKSECHEASPNYFIPQIVQRNVLKVSKQFKSIKNGSQEGQHQNYQLSHELFKNQKMSQSFIRQQNDQDTIQAILNQRLINFQQFSSAWIQKVVAGTPNKKNSSTITEEVQDETIKEEVINCLSVKRINQTMTDRPKVEKESRFEYDAEDINAKSQTIASEQLQEERQFVIHEEISYFIPHRDPYKKKLTSATPSRRYQGITD